MIINKNQNVHRQDMNNSASPPFLPIFKGSLRINLSKDVNKAKLPEINKKVDEFIKLHPKAISKNVMNGETIEITFANKVKNVVMLLSEQLDTLDLPFKVSANIFPDKIISSEICQNLARKYHDLKQDEEIIIDFLYNKNKSRGLIPAKLEEIVLNNPINFNQSYSAIKSLEQRGLINVYRSKKQNNIYEFTDKFFEDAGIIPHNNSFDTIPLSELSSLRIINVKEKLDKNELEQLENCLQKLKAKKINPVETKRFDTEKDINIAFYDADAPYLLQLMEFIKKKAMPCELTISERHKKGSRFIPEGIKVLFKDNVLKNGNNENKKTLSVNFVKENNISMEAQTILEFLLNNPNNEFLKTTIMNAANLNTTIANDAVKELMQKNLISARQINSRSYAYKYLPHNDL